MTLRTGKVYKIICTQSNDVYVGSTFNDTRKRFIQHKYGFAQWKSTNERKLSIYPLFEKYGFDNFKIIVIKEYQVADKNHLLAYEQLWINKTRCVNANNPLSLKPIFIKEYKKKWVAENKDKVQASREKRQEKTNEKNKEKIACECGTIISYRNQAAHRKSQQHLQFIEERDDPNKVKERLEQEREQKLQQKERTSNYQKQYREANKDRLKAYNSETYQCACGMVITKKKRNRHEQSARHIKLIATQ